MHYAGPNAGEIMQGYAVAMKMGLTYDRLTRTVGIHPTVAEEFVNVKVTKSSGESPEKGGCWGWAAKLMNWHVLCPQLMTIMW